MNTNDEEFLFFSLLATPVLCPIIVEQPSDPNATQFL